MPIELHLDQDHDLWALAKIVALPPVSGGHSHHQHAPQQQADTVRLSRTAEILQLAEAGHNATAIARTLGYPQDFVAAVLDTDHDETPTIPLPAQPLATVPNVPNVSNPATTTGPIYVEATRDASGNLVPTPVPVSVVVSLAEAPPVAVPAGMANPTTIPTFDRRNRRDRRDRRRDRRAPSTFQWSWPLPDTTPNPPAQSLNPWRHVAEDDILEAPTHQWTDTTEIAIRPALPQASE